MSDSTPMRFNVGSYDREMLLKAYREHGAVIVRGVAPADSLESLRNAIRRLLLARLRSMGCEQSEGSGLDDLYIRLSEIDESLIGEIFAIVRNSAEFNQLVYAPELLNVVRDVLPQTCLQVVPESHQLRIDPPGNNKRFHDWHYDYCYGTLSRSYLTAWLPLVAVSREMGYLRGLLGSHKALTPVDYYPDYATMGRFLGHNIYQLHGVDINAMELEAIDFSDMLPGDAVIFNCAFLHRSGHNVSNQSRWTVTARYGDALDPAVVQRGWQTIRGKSGTRLFNELHPELVFSMPPAREAASRTDI
jgi:ectoine hydroxylase-related dioxygenase (phytanoyl-CoA dioxygenase family)